jgi:hypothetical protein
MPPLGFAPLVIDNLSDSFCVFNISSGNDLLTLHRELEGPSEVVLKKCNFRTNFYGYTYASDRFIDRTPSVSSMCALGVWSSYKGRTVDA